MKRILLSSNQEEIILAVIRNGILYDLHIERPDNMDLVGRIYKGVVKNVVPSVKGVFIDIGIGQNAFLRTKDLLNQREIPTEGSSVLVQVIKDSTEMKGPLVTEKISIAGTYSVTLEGINYIGVSKKIDDEEKRNRLRNMGEKLCPPGLGLIIRTAAENVDETIFSNDIKRLVMNSEIIKKRFNISKGPALLYRDSDIVVKAIRNFVSDKDDLIITDDREIYRRLLHINEEELIIDPDQIQLYKNREPLLEKEGAEEQIHQLFQRQVDLSSGGSIIIDYAEALTAIDVNSGSFREKKMPHEEMAYLINKEAAVEISRQIRLRGIGGMILIDFIDMNKEFHKREIVNILKEETNRDREPVVVYGMTSLGLVEMTRKRTTHRLLQNYYDICPICKGTGYVSSVKSIIQKIYRDLLRLDGAGKGNNLVIYCHPDVADVLDKQEEKELMKENFHKNIKIEINSHPNREVYSILSDD